MKSAKSLMPHISVSDRERYGDLKVMKADAGYYVGSEFKNAEGFLVPATRDSPYYTTNEEATAQLAVVIAAREAMHRPE